VNSEVKEEAAELWLGGDVNLGDGGHGQLQGIAGIVQGRAGIVNLEGPVAESLPTSATKLRLWNSPKSLAELSALNVKVTGIANNHSGDAGQPGGKHTATILRENGILPVGGASGAATLIVHGLTIIVTAHDLTKGVPAGLEAELKSARQRGDILIAMFHVTGPASYLPRPELRHAVEIAYKSGASVIAAHGTHAIGPVERREHAVIAWGLGNIAFACDCTQEQEAILLRVDLGPDGKIEADVAPIQAGLNKKPAGLSKDAAGIFDLLEAMGSSRLQRKEQSASF
jgi:hypothetical protein